MVRVAIDLYCGSGGVTVGLKAAGWIVIVACDDDPIASSTYRANHPEVTLVEKDIREDAAIQEIMAAAALSQVDLLVVCAPCQPFSSQNRKRGGDPREQLLLRPLALVPILQPSLIFFENVPGLVTSSYLPIVEELRTSLAKLGYLLTDPLVRDASRYGVPQRRRRCVMLAAREQVALGAFESAKIEQPRRTVRDAISDLPSLELGEIHPNDRLHRARRHSPLALAVTILERFRVRFVTLRLPIRCLGFRPPPDLCQAARIETSLRMRKSRGAFHRGEPRG